MKLRTAIIIILLLAVAGPAAAFCNIGDYECFQRERELKMQKEQLDIQREQLDLDRRRYQQQRTRRPVQQPFDYTIKTESFYDSFMKGFNDGKNSRDQR